MTLFLRVLDVPAEDKGAALLRDISAVRQDDARVGLDREPTDFAAIPGSPFAYWVSADVRSVFERCASFEGESRTVKQGLATADDFRFVRLWWEVNARDRWSPFAKGGAFAPFYADIIALLDWERDGEILKAKVIAEYGNAGKRIYNEEYYYRPGLTWPLRGIQLSAQAVPSGCIFSIAGKMAFAEEGELPAYLALFNSRPFDFLVNTRAGKVGGVQYEVGLVQSTPVPDLSPAAATKLIALASRAWSLKRSLDTTNEPSHAFLLPPGLNQKVTGLDREAVRLEVELIQRQIDDAAFALYGIASDDRVAIELSAKTGVSVSRSENPPDNDNDNDDDDGEEEPVTGLSIDALNSWLVGVAFGRFDPRLATGERAIPPEPKPFDALPSRSPGMYHEGEKPSDRPDILVDDEGHADDLAARAQGVAERVKVEVPENLRGWLAKEFFPLHIKMYSKSRRKAPIYWQLATPSASYSVWLYIHAFSNDTLFRVQNDYIAPKLAHEERRLESLTSELRDGATAAQRKQLAAQESLVEELRAFLNEVKRVAPLWKPNLDDGVIINFAPLWRLVPQNKSWQKELKSTWDALCEGKYDWAHLAIHLRPERVVPKCAKDRSLAIAHGLEDVFWAQGIDGKWTARKTPTRSIDELVRERTSPAVKSALKSLLEAPGVVANGRARLGRKRAEAARGGRDPA